MSTNTVASVVPMSTYSLPSSGSTHPQTSFAIVPASEPTASIGRKATRSTSAQANPAAFPASPHATVSPVTGITGGSVASTSSAIAQSSPVTANSKAWPEKSFAPGAPTQTDRFVAATETPKNPPAWSGVSWVTSVHAPSGPRSNTATTSPSGAPATSRSPFSDSDCPRKPWAAISVVSDPDGDHAPSAARHTWIAPFALPVSGAPTRSSSSAENATETPVIAGPAASFDSRCRCTHAPSTRSKR